MATNPLLSTYRTGENRVTSSIMAVFERVDLALVRDILAAATEMGDELRAVTFENQIVTSTGSTIPDARISGHFTWWFETKTARSAYSDEANRKQLVEHALHLVDDLDALLFVLTPDPVRPAWLTTFEDRVAEAVRPRVIWISFARLAGAVEEVADPTRLLGEQTRFLLAELLHLFESDGLLSNDDTVIVAARSAWPEYLRISAYVCQPNRSFREGLTHLGFYADGAIQPRIAAIRHHLHNVLFTSEGIEQLRSRGHVDAADLVDSLLSTGARTPGESYDVLLLSGADDDDTVKLDQPIVNDTKTSTGRAWAWTLGQRYTSLERLAKSPAFTSAL